MKTITGKHSQYTTCQDSAFCCQIYIPGKNVYQSKLWPAWPGGLACRSHGAFVLILPIVVLNKTNQNPPHPGGRDKSDPVGFGHKLERGNRNSIKWCRWETKFNQLQKILVTKTVSSGLIPVFEWWRNVLIQTNWFIKAFVHFTLIFFSQHYLQKSY